MNVLPIGGAFSPLGNGSFGDRLKHLILPVIALTYLPAGLSAQSAIRAMFSSGRKGGMRWLVGLLTTLAGLFRQIGGVVGTLILVEAVFSLPGLGRTFFEALMTRDQPLVYGCLLVFVLVILVGQVLGELFLWIARLIDPVRLLPEKTPARAKFQKNWRIAALVLLVIPVVLTLLGLFVTKNQITRIDPAAHLQAASAAHPLGTDAIGRDLWARIRSGTLVTTVLALIGAGIATLLALPGGLLAGWLGRRRTWWADLLADLVLFPADVLLFVPLVALGALVMGQANKAIISAWALAGVLLALPVLPRMLRLMAGAWTASSQEKTSRRFWNTLALLFTASFTVSFAGITAINFLGLGVKPPLPTLGSEIGINFTRIMQAGTFLVAGLVIWAFLFVLHLLVDSLAEDYSDKDWLSLLDS